MKKKSIEINNGLLIESNVDIKKLDEYFISRVILLRKLNPNSEYLKITRQYQNEVSLPWMKKYYMTNTEPSKRINDEIINDLLDICNELNKLIDSYKK